MELIGLEIKNIFSQGGDIVVSHCHVVEGVNIEPNCMVVQQIYEEAFLLTAKEVVSDQLPDLERNLLGLILVISTEANIDLQKGEELFLLHLRCLIQ